MSQTSRARAICVLVASPAIFEAECRTPRQIKLANAFCDLRYLYLTNVGRRYDPADVRPQPAQNQPMIEKTKSGSRVGNALVGAFATVAGIGEIVVGLTGNYLGILAHSIPPATSTIIIGAFYSLGGLSILTSENWERRSAFFYRLRSPGAAIPCDDWHRSLDRRRRTQDRHWRLDCARRYWLRGVAVEKVRLDRASGGGRRVEVAIVHKLIEFSTILGNAQTF